MEPVVAFYAQMNFEQIESEVVSHGLFIMGSTGTIVLVGADKHWWKIFSQSPEFKDDIKDPVDRWSKRVLNEIAAHSGATSIFPSDGPPYAPFISWALETGQFWQSPTGMMIHERAGLMISIRGALQFSTPFHKSLPKTNPCHACIDMPCTSACPVDALSNKHHYNVPECKAYLKSASGGKTCMSLGCEARRVCPVSQSFGRLNQQSAFHMQAFMRAST